MSRLRVLAVADLKPDAPDDAPQSQAALSPVTSLSAAEGEKLRLGGQLRAGAVAPVAGVSIRALLLRLPSLFRAESAADHYPRSLVLSYSVNGCFSRMRNQLRPHQYRGCVKMLSLPSFPASQGLVGQGG